MNLKKIIRKSKRRQLFLSLIFIIMLLICLYIIFTGNNIKRSLYMVTILCALSAIYFLKRLFNFNSLIEYYGQKELSIKELLNIYDSPVIYFSENKAFCDHIVITHNAIFLIDNTLKIIPILDIQEIIFD